MSWRINGKDSVTVEMMLHRLLGWLAGGNYLDIKLSVGIGKAEFYHFIYKCMDAILYSNFWHISFQKLKRTE